MSTYNTKNYTEQGGDVTHIGGKLIIEEGATVEGINAIAAKGAAVSDATDDAVTVATNTGNNNEDENLFVNSSKTKTVPAIGALKVAPIAEPAPDAINFS